MASPRKRRQGSTPSRAEDPNNRTLNDHSGGGKNGGCITDGSVSKHFLSLRDSHHVSDLVVPIVMWHAPPRHPVTCMAVSPAHSHIVTGDANGRLVIWEVFTPVTESSNSSKEVRKRLG